MVDPHRHLSPSPHQDLPWAYPPPVYYLPLEPAVMGAGNVASTSLNLSLSGENPLSNVSNPPAVCYHFNRYSDVILVLVGLAWWGWRNPRRCVDREPGRHRHLACHRELQILII